MSNYVDPKFTPLLGQTISSVSLQDNKETFVVELANGQEVRYGVEGDCCSSSWIEHLEAPSDLRGGLITGAEDGGSVEEPSDDYECLKVYHTTIHTTKGDVVLEFRNSSNGYYGGWLFLRS